MPDQKWRKHLRRLRTSPRKSGDNTEILAQNKRLKTVFFDGMGFRDTFGQGRPRETTDSDQKMCGGSDAGRMHQADPNPRVSRTDQ